MRKRRLTGERPMEGATPDSLLALHAAGYREMEARLGAGRVLDVGCGTGAETMGLAGDGRTIVGIDYSAQTVVDAHRKWGAVDKWFAGMDGACLGFKTGSFDAVCSSHIIEHFTDPRGHVAELARATADDGMTFVLTPNAPADFENPFHVYLFEPDDLRWMLEERFADVKVLGLEGDDALHADFAARRASAQKILRLDVFNLRKKIPRRWYVWLYERVLPIVYRLLGKKKSGVGSGLDASHLFMSETITPHTPVLFAVARRPRR